jgi:hypothetical protein
MRSRGIMFAQGRVLSTLVLRRFLTHPLGFFFPPRAEPAPTEMENGSTQGNGG